jgi:hypothetical protein
MRQSGVDVTRRCGVFTPRSDVLLEFGRVDRLEEIASPSKSDSQRRLAKGESRAMDGKKRKCLGCQSTTHERRVDGSPGACVHLPPGFLPDLEVPASHSTLVQHARSLRTCACCRTGFCESCLRAIALRHDGVTLASEPTSVARRDDNPCVAVMPCPDNMLHRCTLGKRLIAKLVVGEAFKNFAAGGR